MSKRRGQNTFGIPLHRKEFSAFVSDFPIALFSLAVIFKSVVCFYERPKVLNCSRGFLKALQ